MMEFTLSRVVLAVCGVLLLGAVIAPFAASEENVLSGAYQGQTDAIADAMDSFYESTQKTAFIDMEKLLPNEDCSLSFSGKMITLNDGQRDYNAVCRYTVESDDVSFDCNDMLFLTKDDGKVIVHGLR